MYLNIKDIDHTRTRAKSPQANGICECFHGTMQEEFYAIAFRQKLYGSLEETQTGIEQCLRFYNSERIHTGRYCYGKTPMQTFGDSKRLAQNKDVSNLFGQNATFKPSGEAEAGFAGEHPVRNSRMDGNEKAAVPNAAASSHIHFYPPCLTKLTTCQIKY